MVPTSRPAACSERIAALPAGAGALDEHVHLAHAVLGGLAGGVSAAICRGERRRLAGALEADVPLDAQLITLPAGSVIETMVLVERALDVRVAVRDVLLFLAPHLLDGASA